MNWLKITIIDMLFMHTPEQLNALSRVEKNARKRIRLLALSHFVDGYNRTQHA